MYFFIPWAPTKLIPVRAPFFDMPNLDIFRMNGSWRKNFQVGCLLETMRNSKINDFSCYFFLVNCADTTCLTNKKKNQKILYINCVFQWKPLQRFFIGEPPIYLAKNCQCWQVRVLLTQNLRFFVITSLCHNLVM